MAPAGHGEGQRAAAAVVDHRAEFAQGRDERPNGALAGPRVAVEGDLPEGECRDGRYETQHRPGVSDVDRANGPVASAGRAWRHSPRRPQARRPRHGLLVDADAERSQRRRHQQGVPRAQRPSDQARTVRERREHQRPVSDRLGARQRDDGAHRPGSRWRVPVLARRDGAPPGLSCRWSAARARLRRAVVVRACGALSSCAPAVLLVVRACGVTLRIGHAASVPAGCAPTRSSPGTPCASSHPHMRPWLRRLARSSPGMAPACHRARRRGRSRSPRRCRAGDTSANKG